MSRFGGTLLAVGTLALAAACGGPVGTPAQVSPGAATQAAQGEAAAGGAAPAAAQPSYELLQTFRDRYRDRRDGRDVFDSAVRVCDVAASSSQDAFSARRAIDGDSDTEWASGGYQRPSAALVLDLCSRERLRAAVLKTGPTKGSYYRFYTSSNGDTWQPASRRITFTDWDAHVVPITGTGRYLRLQWYNPAGVDHAAVFTLRVLDSGFFGGFTDSLADRFDFGDYRDAIYNDDFDDYQDDDNFDDDDDFDRYDYDRFFDRRRS